MMDNELQMSMMRELTFFLGIQVKQTKQGMLVHQAKYTNNLMKKFNMVKLKPVSTLMSMTTALDLDEIGDAVDQKEYKSMIGSLLYACVHAFKLPHALHIDKSFNGSSGISNTHSNLGFCTPLLHRLILLAFPMLILWVVELIKNTSSTCHFLGSSLVSWFSHKQSSIAQSTTEAEYVATVPKFFG
jgi:hypothetical protein